MVKLDRSRKRNFAISLGFLARFTYCLYEIFLSNIPMLRVRSHIPAEAFSPGCMLVIRQVEKGHRTIHRKNSRACRVGRKNLNKVVQIARIISRGV